jgi:hypothetical protein
MIQHDLIQNVLIQNVLIQNALIQKCPDSKCPGLVARHGEELWIYEYKYTKKDTSPGHFESGHFESRHFESGHFESGHVESGHFESGHVESWRFVTVPYHYCSIYVRSYTRRWSRMSSFKQKNQNTKSWSGAINLWIQIQIHKKKDRRFVTVPYHYCSIYVRNYTRRWSLMSSFKQKNQNTKTWSGAINLWIQIHKKRIQVPDILNQDIFGSCHVESWRFVAILFNIW